MDDACDRRPGPTSEIRCSGDSVTFEFDLPVDEGRGWLALRGDEHGNIWATIGDYSADDRENPRRRG